MKFSLDKRVAVHLRDRLQSFKSLATFSCLFFFFAGRIQFLRLHEVPLFAFLGFLGMFVSQLCYLVGVYFAGPSLASTLQSLTPVFAAFAAILFRIERITSFRLAHTWAKFLGILCAAAGAAAITLVSDDGDSSSHAGHSNMTNVTSLQALPPKVHHCTDSTGNSKVCVCPSVCLSVSVSVWEWVSMLVWEWQSILHCGLIVRPQCVLFSLSQVLLHAPLLPSPPAPPPPPQNPPAHTLKS